MLICLLHLVEDAGLSRNFHSSNQKQVYNFHGCPTVQAHINKMHMHRNNYQNNIRFSMTSNNTDHSPAHQFRVHIPV